MSATAQREFGPVGVLVSNAYAVEVPAAVAFLASPEAAYVTGASLAVDGGWTATRSSRRYAASPHRPPGPIALAASLHVARPPGPGLGIEVDEDAVRRASAHAWRNPVWRHEDGSFAEW